MKFLALALAMGLQIACATGKPLLDRDYEVALNSFRRQDYSDALSKFPSGEPGGFVTSLERAWIHQWLGEWKPELLKTQAELIEQRKPVWLSREAGILFRQEAEHEYRPAEHEIVTLHLVYATHLLQAGRQEAAQVELRRAGLVLENQWDDPGLRLWLAALWKAAGNWEEARVDLRRAHELNGEPHLKLWSEMESPPPELRLSFYGVAPAMQWEAGEYKPRFIARAPAAARPAPVAFSTERWFDHHLQKDHDVRDFARTGNFWVQNAGNQTLTYTERAGAKSLVAGVKITGVVVGTGLTAGALYLLSQSGGAASSGSSALLGLTIGAGVAIWKYADEIDRRMTAFLRQQERRKQELLRSYRIVRFLPAWIGLGSGQAAPSARQVALGNGVWLQHLN